MRIENLHVKNRATTRSQTYNIFCGQDCVVDVDGYTHSGSVSDSIVSYGTQQLGGTACTISNATIFAPLSTIRQFPLTTATGMFRVLEADGTMRTFNTVKLERSQQPIDLVAGTSPVKWLRAGLHIGYEVLVTAGVPANSTSPDVPGLTLTIGRTSVASVPLDWEAGKVKRSSTWVGGGIYPMASAYTQGTKVTAAVRAGATLPAGAKVVVTLLSLSYEGWADTINEPGSAQVDRFLSGAGTTTSGGGGSSSVSYDGLPPNIEITVPKTGGSWPSTRPFARTDLTAHLVGPGDPPGWMTGNDYQTQTPS